MSSNVSAPETTRPETADPTTHLCDPDQMPSPAREHEWLQKFVGEWDSEVEVFMEPGMPPMTFPGYSRDRMLGGFWLISEGGNDSRPYHFILTLGYDPEKKKYVGSWTDTMSSYMWRYEGTVNDAGDTLALETEGPSPMSPGKHSKFREVTEFKSKDLRVFTSSILREDGTSTMMLRVTARRTK